MSEFRELGTHRLDLSIVGDTVGPFSVQGMQKLIVQAELFSGAWGAGVVSVYVSASRDGSFVAAATPFSTITSDAIHGPFDVGGYAYVRLIVTTAASAAILSVTPYAEESP